MQIRIVNAAVAAGGVVQNVVAGSAFEFLGRPSRVRVRNTRSAAGTVAPVVTVQFGSEVQIEDGAIPIERVVNTGPSQDDPPMADDVGQAGDRLVVRIRNTDTVPQTFTTMVEIIPLA